MSTTPNIVVFMADQMRAPAPGGDYPCPTPHMDGIAAEGVRFEQTFCPSPICSPSRSTFHTGLMPSFHRIYINVHHTYSHRELDTRIPTLASVLRGRGYRTGFSGVWHCSRSTPVTDYGFDTATGEEPMFAAGEAQPVRSISVPGDDFSGKQLLAAVYEDIQGAYSVEKEVASAIAFLEECAKKKDEPFFLYVSTRIPHVAWCVTESDLQKVPLEHIPLPESFSEDTTGARCPEIFEYNGRDYAYWTGSSEELREALRCYYALITKVDEQVGVLADALRRLGMDEDTLFLLTSDHAEMAGAHNLIGKGFDFYDEVLRVPMIARWPGHIDAGRRLDRIVGFEDIMPTFCDVAGAAVPDGCRGRSLTPLFGGTGDVEWRDEILVEQYNHVFPGYAVGLRSREWLYVFNPTRGEQLYDHRRDPGETVNLALEPACAGELREWRTRVAARMQETEHPLAKRIATAVGFMHRTL